MGWPSYTEYCAVSFPDIEPEAEQCDGSDLEGQRIRAAKRLCLLAMLALAAAVGVLEQLFSDDRGIDRLLTIACAVLGIILVVVWCQYDARERSYSIRRPLRLLIIFFAVIGVPVYLLHTRGRRGLIAVLIAALFFGLCLFTEQVAIEITYRVLTAEPEPSLPQLPNGYRLVRSYSDGPRVLITTAPGKPLSKMKTFKDGSRLAA